MEYGVVAPKKVIHLSVAEAESKISPMELHTGKNRPTPFSFLFSAPAQESARAAGLTR
jgi:hypothetical protein